MPYITGKDRAEVGDDPRTAGELNYLISDIIGSYTRVKGISYATLNEVVGVMESAKTEYQRQIVAPYETLKIMENGDIHPYSYIKKEIGLRTMEVVNREDES